MANALEYFNKLEDYMNNSRSTEDFKLLYKEYFNTEPDEKLVTNYESNRGQVEDYEEEDSYEESYETSYDEEEDDSYTF